MNIISLNQIWKIVLKSSLIESRRKINQITSDYLQKINKSPIREFDKIQRID